MLLVTLAFSLGIHSLVGGSSLPFFMLIFPNTRGDYLLPG